MSQVQPRIEGIVPYFPRKVICFPRPSRRPFRLGCLHQSPHSLQSSFPDRLSFFHPDRLCPPPSLFPLATLFQSAHQIQSLSREGLPFHFPPRSVVIQGAGVARRRCPVPPPRPAPRANLPEAIESLERESPRSATYAVSVRDDIGAEMPAADVLAVEEGHFFFGLFFGLWFYRDQCPPGRDCVLRSFRIGNPLAYIVLIFNVVR